MFLTIHRSTKALFATFALTASVGGCSGQYDSTAGGNDLQDEETPAAKVEEPGGIELSSLGEAVYYSDSVACETYEAEDIGRAGGIATSQGWKLRYAGENINVVRQFTTGSHQFSVVAWGTKGTDGSLPKFKLTLNDVQIGADVTVTNTSYTSGWSEYTVDYNVQTPNNKQIKVELANPGNGRAILIDGIIVHCPGDGVNCGSEPYAEACCPASGQMIPGECGTGLNTGTMYCDQNSDCVGSEVCAFRGNAQTGFAVSCESTNNCTSGSGYICGKLCKTPTTAETTCNAGTVCTELNVPGFMELPGFKYCH